MSPRKTHLNHDLKGDSKEHLQCYVATLHSYAWGYGWKDCVGIGSCFPACHFKAIGGGKFHGKTWETGHSRPFFQWEKWYLQDEGASFRSNLSKFPERMIDYVGKNIWKSVSILAENKTPFPTFFGNDHPTQLQDLPDDKVGQCPWCSRWCKSQLDSGAKEAKYNWCQMILSFRRD